MDTLLCGFGIGAVGGGVTIVGREGAGRRLELPLTLDERDRLTTSAERLREVARGLGY